MSRNYNQSKKYNVSFNTGKTACWEFQMCEHPTQYGNGSAVFENDEFRVMCDTRYDSVIMKDFNTWCIEYLNEYFNPAYEPKIVEG